jgi:hypothetical protein
LRVSASIAGSVLRIGDSARIMLPYRPEVKRKARLERVEG